MSWLTPTIDDLRGSLGADEIDLLAAKSIAEGQEVVAQVLTRTVNRVRGAVRRSGVAMGPAGTIPDEALSCTMEIAATDLLRRLNIELKASRIDARKEAIAWLEAVAQNKEQVVPYGDDTNPTGGQTPRVTARTRTYGRDYEDGI
jgi:hypothetical protein